MANKVVTLQLKVIIDENSTDDESIATALDTLLETAMSTPGILDEYGAVAVSEFMVEPTCRADEQEE